MSFRYLAGYITESYNPLKVPNAPTLGTVTPASGQVTVAFTAPSNVGGGAITSYTVIVTDSSSGATFSGTGASSPIVVTGLTNGNTYTAKVFATNAYGPSAFSTPSGSFSYAPKLFTWGNNNDGELGQNDIVLRSSPVQVGSSTDWNVVNSADASMAGVKTNGTLWTWGRNQFGELGQNLDSSVKRSSPTQVGALTTWSSLGAAKQSIYAIKTDGTLWAWGYNNYGQLGQNNKTNVSSPVQVGSLTNWAKVSPYAQDNALFIKTDGTLWALGYNFYGQLGDNSIIARSSPVQIGADTNWSQVATDESTIALKTNGTIWAWGNNSHGQLGQNDTIRRSSPVQVGALTTWTYVATALETTFALKTDGTLWAWGWANDGVLGNNDANTSYSSPIQIGALTNWSKIAAAGSGTAGAVKTDGTIWMWGSNYFGNLGQNNVILRSSPVQVGTGSSWSSISVSPYITSAITSS